MPRWAVGILLVLASPAWGQWVTFSYEQAPPNPASWVRVPEVAPPPAPAPAPGSVPVLKAGELFVIESLEASFLVPELDSPLSVREMAGPVTLYAKFHGGTDFEYREFAGKKVYSIRAVKPGRGSVIVVKEGAKSPADVFRQLIDSNTGPLPPPVPPGPTPPVPPDPPKPDPPKPDPAPIPAPGLRVLLVYESAELAKLTAGQRAVLYSAKVRAHLDSVCVKGPDGKTAEWRLWDANVDTAGESAIWQNVMKRARASLPWVVISNPGKGGFEGQLPDGAEAFLALLKKYEGGGP